LNNVKAAVARRADERFLWSLAGWLGRNLWRGNCNRSTTATVLRLCGDYNFDSTAVRLLITRLRVTVT